MVGKDKLYSKWCWDNLVLIGGKCEIESLLLTIDKNKYFRYIPTLNVKSLKRIIKKKIQEEDG